jgi:hypothetical protein
MLNSTPARDFVLSIFPSAKMHSCHWAGWKIIDENGTNLSQRWTRGIYAEYKYPAECYAWEGAALNIKEEMIRKLEE